MIGIIDPSALARCMKQQVRVEHNAVGRGGSSFEPDRDVEDNTFAGI